jgi:hypothetical protein
MIQEYPIVLDQIWNYTSGTVKSLSLLLNYYRDRSNFANGWTCVEKFLNDLVEYTEEAHLDKLIMKFQLRISSDYAMAPPNVAVYEQFGNGEPSDPFTWSEVDSPDIQFGGQCNAYRYIAGQRMKFLTAFIDSGQSLVHHLYEGEISLKPKRSEKGFYWSDEMLEDPNNQSYHALYIDSQQNIKEVEITGSGVAFVDIDELKPGDFF